MFILSKLHGTSKKSIMPLPWGHPIPVGPGAASSKLTPLSIPRNRTILTIIFEQHYNRMDHHAWRALISL
jgi:hypothetical protein